MAARYVIHIDTRRHVRWYRSDSHARRVAARYARRMFPTHDSLWNESITVHVYRTPVDNAGVVKYVPAIQIGRFEVAAASEWCRKG